MAITRYDPFRELFQLQDQLFRTFDSAVRSRSGQPEDTGLTGAWAPLVDVFEDADGITLKGERKLEDVENKEGWHRIERTYGTFYRSFTLPQTVDAEHISAETKDGV